jgi:hypothetical protein
MFSKSGSKLPANSDAISLFPAAYCGTHEYSFKDQSPLIFKQAVGVFDLLNSR